MKRPNTIVPKRPRSMSSAVVKSRKEAAIHLVRLEFDLSRLELGAKQAQQRLIACEEEISEKRRQRTALLSQLNG
ncbi:MAG: hypothetical protein AAGA87_06660 [Pseudomonadota bacterium]